MNADHPSHQLRIEAIRRAMQRDDVRARISAGVRAWDAKPETRAKRCATWADPAVRKARSEGIRRAQVASWSQPNARLWRAARVRTGCDALTPEQVEQLLDQLRRGERAIDVANDWLISLSRVYAIAREKASGIQRLRGGA